eukprot:NODE_354_length_2614_cov_89.676435_g334_i0.p1 GENE.NODE_354_length_2614_cov_89.676435_g334_i0~~NODE_354_length_2614_cov_89.676435_g334_i0.p1  ORF type:complete len:784 (-),score=87.78 NODE_354_length_2614_cov_89.676435_g334_i0:185-2536(-)
MLAAVESQHSSSVTTSSAGDRTTECLLGEQRSASSPANCGGQWAVVSAFHQSVYNQTRRSNDTSIPSPHSVDDDTTSPQVRVAVPYDNVAPMSHPPPSSARHRPSGATRSIISKGSRGNTSKNLSSLSTLGQEDDVEDTGRMSGARRTYLWFRKRITITHQLAFIIAVPVTWLILLTSSMLSMEYELRNTAVREGAISQAAAAFSEVLFTYQREGAITGVWMDGHANFSKVESTRAFTVAATNYIHELHVSHPSLSLWSQRTMETLLHSMNGLNQHRVSVDAGRLTGSDALIYYATVTADVLDILHALAMLNASPQYTVIGQIANALSAKRMLGIHIIDHDFITHAEYKELVVAIAFQQDAMEKYLATTTAINVDIIRDMLVSPTYLATVDVQNMMLNNCSTCLLQQDIGLWFDNMTSQVQIFSSLSRNLKERIMVGVDSRISNAEAQIVVRILQLVFTIAVSSLLCGWLARSVHRSNEQMREEIVERKEVEKCVAKFVPKQFLSLLNIDNINDIQLGVATVDRVTIMFTDVHNFTTMSEQMDHQQAFKWVLELTKVLGTVLKRHSGFVDKYMGDGMLCIFLDAQLAVQCAIRMESEIDSLNAHRNIDALPLVSVGIGIHTGNVCVGIIGDESRLDTTIISDTVNLASRLEGLTRYYGNRIIASASTLNEADMTQFMHRTLGSVKVKGRNSNIDIFDIYHSDPQHIKNYKKATQTQFETAIAAYQRGDLRNAVELFESLEAHQQLSTVATMDPAVRLKTEFAKKLHSEGKPNDWQGEDVFAAK